MRIRVAGAECAISVSYNQCKHERHQRCDTDRGIDRMPDPVCAATSEVLSHYRRSGKAQRHHRQEQRLHHARADSETGLFASGRGYVRKKFCRLCRLVVATAIVGLMRSRAVGESEEELRQTHASASFVDEG